MSQNYSQFNPAGALTGTEIMPLMQGGVTLRSTSAGVQTFIRNQGTFSSPLAPTGVAATDTANLIAAINLAASSARALIGASDPIGTAVIYFAPGTFTVNSANALMGPTTLSAKLRGLKMVGCGGVGQTALVFTPSVAGPMMTNQRWQAITAIDISFSCTVAGCDFLQSQEQGGLTNIQANNWVRCGWSGFQNTFMLTGGNNNSENTWDTCSFGVTASNVLYVPPTATATITAGQANIAVANSPEVFPLGATMTFTATLGNLILNTSYYIVASTATAIQIAATALGTPMVPSSSGSLSANCGSDEFLNFSFHNCKYDPASSNAPWVNMGKGGHVVFTGTMDVSGWSPTVDTYLINTLGNAHAQGVCNLLVSKLRIECLSDHALLWHNQWPMGNCTWNNVDQSSAVAARTNTVNYVLVELLNVAGPNIVYDNCNFLGTHTYTYGSNNFTAQSSIKYRSVDVLQQPNAASFCLFTELATNSGGAPRVDFDEQCNGNDPTEIFPTNLNWHRSTFGTATTKTVNFVGANSDAPLNGGNIQRKLPINAVARSVLWNKQGNALSGTFGFNMQSIEATPTVLSSFAGANAGTAANPAATPVNFWMTTDAQRTIQLLETAGRTSPFTGYIATVTYDG